MLMCAAKYGHVAIVELLLAEFGARRDETDTKVATILCVVSFCPHNYDVMQTGCTALTLATQAKQFDVVQLLVENGADMNIQENVNCNV